MDLSASSSQGVAHEVGQAAVGGAIVHYPRSQAWVRARSSLGETAAVRGTHDQGVWREKHNPRQLTLDVPQPDRRQADGRAWRWRRGLTGSPHYLSPRYGASTSSITRGAGWRMAGWTVIRSPRFVLSPTSCDRAAPFGFGRMSWAPSRLIGSTTVH